MIFSLLKMCLLISLFFWLADLIYLIPKDAEQQSYLYKVLHNFAPDFIAWISDRLPWVKGEINQVEIFFKSISK